MKNNNINNEEKRSKLKDGIKTFKEAWAIPQKRAGIKLLGYLIFFIFFFVIAALGSSMESNKVREEVITTTTTLNTESYSYKQKLLLENKYNVFYDISYGDEKYKINGVLNKGILEGYLESAEDIKKIKLENYVLYDISKDDSVEINHIDINFISPAIIFKEIMDKRVFIEEVEDLKVYNYKNINNKEDVLGLDIKIYVGKENIVKIEVVNGDFSYILNFEV